MSKDISIDDISDEALTRIWEAVMEQAAKEYIDLYIVYLRNGDGVKKRSRYGSKYISVKESLIELEDYILGDLIAGPHALYIIKNLRKEAVEHVESGSSRRKEIMRRG